MDIRPCDIILVRGDGIIQEEIEEISHSKYSHVAGIVDNDCIIEAQGFRKTGYNSIHYYENYYDVYRYDDLTYDQQKKILKYVKIGVGSRYSYLLIFFEFLRYTFGWKIPNFGKAIICSTLWVEAYRSVGIDLCPGIKYPSPADVALSLKLHKVN